MISLSSFAKSREVSADTVATYIRRHKETFKGMTERQGNKMFLDDRAVELLEEVYPLPKPIEIIEDTESRQKLIMAQEYIIQLQAKMTEQATLLAKAESTQALLESKTTELAELKEKYDTLQTAYEAELKKSWWDKFRGK